MLRLLSQGILNGAGFIAALFISKDAANFDFIKMGVALLLIMFAVVLCWYVPTLLHRRNSH